MDQARPNFFSGPYIDRREEAREEPGWLEAALADPATLYLLAKGTTQLVQTKPEPRIEFVTREHPVVREVEPRQFVLLGWFRGTRCVLIELEPERSVSLPRMRASRSCDPFRRFCAAMSRVCSRTRVPCRSGAPARNSVVCAASRPLHGNAGHVLHCTNPICGHEFFPRIDPAIIVLVTDGERALLGRQASWPPGRYSTIAGFVGAGGEPRRHRRPRGDGGNRGSSYKCQAITPRNRGPSPHR